MMKVARCLTAVLICQRLTACLQSLQEVNISIGVVTTTVDNAGHIYVYTDSFSPRRDVLVTTHFNWTTVNPRNPFSSIRHLSGISLCDVDINIWGIAGGLAQLLMASMEVCNGRVLLWYGGVVQEMTLAESSRGSGSDHHTDCSIGSSLYPPLPVDGGSLSSDFLALKGHYTRVLSWTLYTLGWDSFVLITDQTTVYHINSILSAIMSRGYKITQFQVLDDMDTEQLLNGLRDAFHSTKSGKTHFVVFCEIECITKLIRQAEMFDKHNGGKTALSYMSSWLLVTLAEHRAQIEQLLAELNNIAVLTPTARIKPQVELQQMTELLRSSILEVFTASNLSRMYPDVDTNKDMYLRATIESLIRHVHTQDRSRPCSTCSLFEVHTALWKPDGRRFSRVARYSNNNNAWVHQDGIFPNMNFGFNNQTLSVATNPWPLFVVKNEETGELQGLCMDLLLELSSKMNFSFALFEPADGEWGVVRSDGRWTGLVGELETGRANLTMAPLAVTADREEVADFAFPFYYDYNGVLIKKPDASKSKWRTLVDIFTYPVYVGIVVSLPIMTVLMCLFERCNPYYQHYTHGQRGGYAGLHNFQDALWYMYGALLTQGGVFLPKSQAGRTLLSFWWLYSIIMVASYSGNLIASLTVTTDRLPFNTLKEMLEQTEYKWGTTSGTYLNVLFEDSNLTDYRRLWEGIKSFSAEIDSLSEDHETHINMVKQGGYGYINDKSGTVRWLSEECDLVLIKEEFFPMTYAIGLPNNSPYKDMFSNQMLKIVESGLMQIWKQKWWPKRNFCSGPVKAVAKTIQLEDVQSAFYILFIGVVLGSFAVLIENIRKNYKDSKLKTDNINIHHVSTTSFPVTIDEAPS